jgi:ATP-dependent DNA helicase RecQ
MADWLVEQGYKALPYHAGMTAEKRAKNQERFLREDNIIMVATIAFGMGIDKPDVRFVAHLSIPKNIEAYYQETGRAGRDGLPANALMIYGMSDAAMQRGFIEDSDAPAAQKRIEHQKLGALLGLCEAARCRRQIMLEYFSDSCEPCGNCDTCLSPPQSFDGAIAAQKALSAVYRTGQRFGVNYLIDILLGKTGERTHAFKHDQLSVFGIGTEFSKQDWQSIFRQLVAQNFLKVDMEEHGGLSITPEGHAFLKEKQPLRLRKHESKSKTKERKAKVTAEIAEFKNAGDDHLFTALKARRMELAKAQNVPPYVIFHDKTLREFTVQKPSSRAQMLGISGVGETKMDRYGQQFLDVIAQFELA